MDTDTPMKQCTKCGEEKPATPEYFARDKNKATGLRGQCRLCHRARQREQKRNSSDEQKEKQKAAVKKWWQNHPEKARDYTRRFREKNPNYQKEYAAKNPDKVGRRLTGTPGHTVTKPQKTKKARPSYWQRVYSQILETDQWTEEIALSDICGVFDFTLPIREAYFEWVGNHTVAR